MVPDDRNDDGKLFIPGFYFKKKRNEKRKIINISTHPKETNLPSIKVLYAWIMYVWMLCGFCMDDVWIMYG